MPQLKETSNFLPDIRDVEDAFSIGTNKGDHASLALKRTGCTVKNSFQGTEASIDPRSATNTHVPWQLRHAVNSHALTGWTG